MCSCATRLKATLSRNANLDRAFLTVGPEKPDRDYEIQTNKFRMQLWRRIEDGVCPSNCFFVQGPVDVAHQSTPRQSDTMSGNPVSWRQGMLNLLDRWKSYGRYLG